MDYQHALLLVQTVTPLHVGCGQDVGVVDLPVIRERTTGYPFIPGSGLRGALRDRFEAGDPELAKTLFGPPVGEDEEVRYAGCAAVHDAKLLLFPVRSDRGVFLWTTCPAVLERFSRETGVFLASGGSWSVEAKGPPGEEELLGPEGLGGPDGTVYLEEYRFTTAGGEGGTVVADRNALGTWAGKVGTALGRADLAGRTVLVSNRTFAHFVRFATLVVQRNALTAEKTVKDGALFSLEAVPPEAVFYGFLGATGARRPELEPEEASREKMLGKLRQGLTGEEEGTEAWLHLGGDESTGLGVSRLTWTS